MRRDSLVRQGRGRTRGIGGIGQRLIWPAQTVPTVPALGVIEIGDRGQMAVLAVVPAPTVARRRHTGRGAGVGGTRQEEGAREEAAGQIIRKINPSGQEGQGTVGMSIDRAIEVRRLPALDANQRRNVFRVAGLGRSQAAVLLFFRRSPQVSVSGNLKGAAASQPSSRSS